MTGILYLLPVGLGDSDLSAVLPQKNMEIIRELSWFIAENAKEARAFLKQCAYPEISRAQLSLINQHAKAEELRSFLDPLLQGHNMGLMSDAGCPGIADPGAEVIRIAHQKGIRVVPLVGPSSIVLSIMASGFNGQNFAFAGYLPQDSAPRASRIRELESLALRTGQTQLFIETPYRNAALFQALLQTLQPHTRLAIGSGLTLAGAAARSQSAREWRQHGAGPDNQTPAVFAIGR